MRTLIPPGCLALALLVGLLVLLPVFLADVMLAALADLGLSPQVSALAVFGIFVGGLINIPVRRIEREEPVAIAVPGLFGFGRLGIPQMIRRTSTVIAVNVGGCVIPSLIAGYQLVRMAGEGTGLLTVAVVSVAINTGVCYWFAQPVPGEGIVMRPLIPALVAAVCGLVLAPDLAPSVAFTAGVLGPLLGADLLHLRDMQQVDTGMLSIGGAGTFDGIVLSGLVATLLA